LFQAFAQAFSIVDDFCRILWSEFLGSGGGRDWD
jgi:hypothetical protein